MLSNAAPAKFKGTLLGGGSGKVKQQPAQTPKGAAAGELVAVYKPGSGAGSAHALSRSWPNKSSTGATVSYEVLFDPGFEWSCGGKLGGFFVGKGAASGCRHTGDGASFRIMWQRDGGAIAYVYVPTGTPQPAVLMKKAACGTAVFASEFRAAFKTGVWHKVEIGLKLNTPGKADGEMWMSIDGKRAALSGVTWRKAAGLGVEKFDITTFHGGPCKASKTSSARFRNVSVR